MKCKAYKLWLLCLFFVVGSIVHADPVQIVSVDSSDYPRIQMSVAIRSPHPSFIPRKTDDRLAFSEIFDHKEIIPKAVQKRFDGDDTSILNLVIVLDATRSVSKKSFSRSRQAARKLLLSLSAQDRSAIYALKNKPVLEADVSPQHEKQALKLDQIKRDGKRTRLYDSLYSGLYTARSMASGASKEQSVKSVVVLFSDAKDENSYLTDNDCFELTKIGQDLAIPVYVFLSANHKQKQKSKKNITKFSQLDHPTIVSPLLKRLALKTGGNIWPLGNRASRDQAFKQIHSLGRQIHQVSWQTPHQNRGLWPGDKVIIRASMQSGDGSYKAVSSYRVPVGSWIRSKYGRSVFLIFTLLGILVLLLMFLMLFLILISLWMRRLKSDKVKVKSSSELPEEELADLTPYVTGLAGEDTADGSAVLDQQTIPHSMPDTRALHPAPVLMDDERKLYMREYNYRVLQMALREAQVCETATLVKMLNAMTRGKRNYDLFLESTVIGSGRWANIPIHDNTISPIHAKIKRVDRRFVIYDMLSAGGVYLNERKLLRPRGLKDGDEIRIGRSRFLFQNNAAL